MRMRYSNHARFIKRTFYFVDAAARNHFVWRHRVYIFTLSYVLAQTFIQNCDTKSWDRSSLSRHKTVGITVTLWKVNKRNISCTLWNYDYVLPVCGRSGKIWRRKAFLFAILFKYRYSFTPYLIGLWWIVKLKSGFTQAESRTFVE